MKTFKLKPIVALVSLALMASASSAVAEIKINQIEVLGTTPLHSSGASLYEIPSNVQVVKSSDIKNQQGLSIADYMSNNMLGVNVNETQNNPFQQDVNFHGFSASPLLGTPQGLSVYQDGVRINEPFGETVNWDLIPQNAISNINLMPGSNPLFGLNTLGGALSIQTKSGDLNPGFAGQVYGGSWGRRAAEAEFGGSASNGAHYFISGNAFEEDGWRDNSKSKVNQLFTKVGWKGEKTDFNISLSAADNDLNGNGLQVDSLLKTLGRSSVFTQPDNTKNKLGFLTGNLNHYFNKNLSFNAVAYYRHMENKTYNADAAEEDNWPSIQGVINRTATDSNAYGLTGQFNWETEKNKITVGAGYDRSRVSFTQSAQDFSAFSSSRGVGGTLGVNITENTNLRGNSDTWSLFATDTYKVTKSFAVTASGRYNRTEVENKDRILNDWDPQTLTADHTFQRFNPAIGFTYTPVTSLNFFGGYNEGSRAPSAIELGCANPDYPCNLPNAMAGDPPLKQVVARTFEGGLRGRLSNNLKWSAAAYTTENDNDIQFVSITAGGRGYFNNVGQTRRSGLDIGFDLTQDKFRYLAGYSYVKATYESEFDAMSAYNSSANAAHKITVKPGDQIPGIPQHQFKLRAEYKPISNWLIGANIVAFSSQYARGDENNQDSKGKIAGYTVVNADTRYTFPNSSWQVFGKVNNIFDQEYSSGGLLGFNPFNASGAFVGASGSNASLVAPGAPRAGWVGIRYDFNKEKSANIDN